MRAAVICRYPVYREALARLVETCLAPETATLYASLKEAAEQAAAKPVDLVLADIQPDDLEFHDLKAASEAVKPAPLALYAVLSQEDTQAAFEAGVKGCIPKSAPPELVIAALKLIQAGGLYFSDVATLTNHERGDGPLRSRLSARQLEVLRLIEIGQTNKEIAKALGISVATVKLHVQAILNITGARNRTEAALRARGRTK